MHHDRQTREVSQRERPHELYNESHYVVRAILSGDKKKHIEHRD